jgi:hypothetical protein
VSRVEVRRPALIDLPQGRDRAFYQRAIVGVSAVLAESGFAESVYQVGGIRNPGISDIDLLVVVRDESNSDGDPLDGLSVDERYLFTHPCFLVPASLAGDLADYVLLTGHQHLHGREWPWPPHADERGTALAAQTALEFLAKNLLDLYVQLTYRVLKVRVFLQHLRGLKTDVEILGVADDSIAAAFATATALIDGWFERPNRNREITDLAIGLLPLLHSALDQALERHTLYAPADGTIGFAANMVLRPAEKVDIVRRGVRLPRLPALAERRQFNANHRVNRFELRMPITAAASESYHSRRFAFLREVKAFATERFPAFAAPIPPLFYREL